ncbi:hypothetical protein JXB41_01125 [Candidatus Woesearchaeota archaeon]|nr:hypothetical protein [Candidatus Woesearchaeota archaeon]
MDSIIDEFKKEITPQQKKCMLCEEREAHYFVKGSPHNCYCKDCALEQFPALDYLEEF